MNIIKEKNGCINRYSEHYWRSVESKAVDGLHYMGCYFAAFGHPPSSLLCCVCVCVCVCVCDHLLIISVGTATTFTPCSLQLPLNGLQ